MVDEIEENYLQQVTGLAEIKKVAARIKSDIEDAKLANTIGSGEGFFDDLLKDTRVQINKKAVDLGRDRLMKELHKEQYEPGVAGNVMPEPMPKRIDAPNEKVITGQGGQQTNAFIVLGRDRPRSRASGYGGDGDTQAAAIDIVVGMQGASAQRVNEEGERVYADPDFEKDAARIYISQKTKIDENFKLTSGFVGNTYPRSAIGIKADQIRLIGREGIKIITTAGGDGGYGPVDAKNSQNGDTEILSGGGIDLIAGNKTEGLQPIPKGDDLSKALIELANLIDKLAGVVHDGFLYQMKYNLNVAKHWHFSPFFAIPVTLSMECVISGVQTMKDHFTKTQKDLLVLRGMPKPTSLSPKPGGLLGWKNNYCEAWGDGYFNSEHNNTN